MGAEPPLSFALGAGICGRTLRGMSEQLQGRAGAVSREEGLAQLAELWGPAGDSWEQRKADAWARRTLGLDPEQGDSELLAEVDTELAAKYGLRRAS